MPETIVVHLAHSWSASFIFFSKFMQPDQVEKWAKGDEFYLQKDFINAFRFYQKIGNFAKVYFNMGMIFIEIKDYETSVKFFSFSIQADNYLAISHFQIGVSLFFLQEYLASKVSFMNALELLNDNYFINYKTI